MALARLDTLWSFKSVTLTSSEKTALDLRWLRSAGTVTTKLPAASVWPLPLAICSL